MLVRALPGRRLGVELQPQLLNITDKHIRQESFSREHIDRDKGAFENVPYQVLFFFFFIFLKLLTSAFDKISLDPFRACGEAVEFRNSLPGQCTCARAIVHIVYLYSYSLIYISTE